MSSAEAGVEPTKADKRRLGPEWFGGPSCVKLEWLWQSCWPW
jgi:hypothetical protein